MLVSSIPSLLNCVFLASILKNGKAISKAILKNKPIEQKRENLLDYFTTNKNVILKTV